MGAGMIYREASLTAFAARGACVAAFDIPLIAFIVGVLVVSTAVDLATSSLLIGVWLVY